MPRLVFSSFMCSVNYHLLILSFLVIHTYLSSVFFLLLLFHLFLLLFFRPKLISFSFFIIAQLFIPFLRCSALPAVTMSSIDTAIPIFILPCLYFTSSLMLLTVDVSAEHMMGPNIVPCFTTSLNYISSVFPTGVIVIIYVVSFM